MFRLLTLGLFVALVPLSAGAVIVETRGEYVELSASPEFPSPSSYVTMAAHVSLESQSRLIVWAVNGSVVTEGTGLTEITIPAGNIGDETDVEVAIMEGGVVLGTARYILRPAEVDLVWEGRTYVPPLYIGRPLANANANVLVAAFPRIIQSGATVPKEKLNYFWEIDGSVAKNISGYGRHSIEVKPAQFTDPLLIAVTVETTNGLVVARGSASIPPVPPRAVVYEDAPLSGVNFGRAITDGVILSEDEITLKAFPFFATDAEKLSYQWTFNRESVPLDESDPSVATFRKTGSGSGTFPIRVTFEDIKLLFERGTAAFELAL